MPKRVLRHAVEQPLDQNIRLIPLTQGQNSIVDAADYEWLMQWNWFAHWHPNRKNFYATRHEGGKLIGMHAQIIQCVKGFVPDHIDGNTLDNRRSNLQSLPHGLNLAKGIIKSNNTSGIVGVVWDNSRELWKARFSHKHLGRFSNKSDAAAARAKYAAKVFEMGNFKQA